MKQTNANDGELDKVFNKPTGKDAFYLEDEVRPAIEVLIVRKQKKMLEKALSFGSWQKDHCDLHEKYTSACCGCQREQRALHMLQSYQDYIEKLQPAFPPEKEQL